MLLLHYDYVAVMIAYSLSDTTLYLTQWKARNVHTMLNYFFHKLPLTYERISQNHSYFLNGFVPVPIQNNRCYILKNPPLSVRIIPLVYHRYISQQIAWLCLCPSKHNCTSRMSWWYRQICLTMIDQTLTN